MQDDSVKDGEIHRALKDREDSLGGAALKDKEMRSAGRENAICSYMTELERLWPVLEHEIATHINDPNRTHIEIGTWQRPAQYQKPPPNSFSPPVGEICSCLVPLFQRATSDGRMQLLYEIAVPVINNRLGDDVRLIARALTPLFNSRLAGRRIYFQIVWEAGRY